MKELNKEQIDIEKSYLELEFAIVLAEKAETPLVVAIKRDTAKQIAKILNGLRAKEEQSQAVK